MIIAVDSREQKPYKFKGLFPESGDLVIMETGIPEGDYLTIGGSWVDNGERSLLAQDETVVHARSFKKEECALIERKTLADLYGTIGHGRDRFVRELERMKVYGYAAILIEAQMSQIAEPNVHLKHPTQMSPKSVIASLIAWSQRYGIHIVMCPGRANAERICFRILERWHQDSIPLNRKK